MNRELPAARDQRTRAPFLPRILLRLASVLLLVYCVLGSAHVTVESARLISAQEDTTYPESGIVYLAVLAGHTGQLYYSFSSPPNVLQPYGPLFYAVNAVIARASNLNADLTIQRGRLLTFGCFLLCGLVVFLISRKLKFSNTESLLAGAMFLAQPAFLSWNVTVRPDVPCLLGMLLSLLFILREEELGERACVFSGLFAGAAFLLKSSAVGAPIAIGAVLLLNKKHKQALILALSAAIPVAAVLGTLLWRRGPFLEQFTSLSKSVWSISAAGLWMMGSGPAVVLLIPLAIGGIGFLSAIKGNWQSMMIASFALTNLCMGLATIPQIMGNINYFLPALAGCSLLLPFALRMVARDLITIPAGVLAIMLLVAGVIVVLGRDRSVGPRTDYPYDRLHSLSIVSDEPYIAMHGRDPELLDPYTLHSFELRGHWDPATAIGKIQRGEYDLVVVTNGRIIRSYRGISFFGAPIVNSLNANYEVYCVAGDTLVLKPRLREVAISSKTLSSVLGPCVLGGADQLPNLSLEASTR